MGDLTVKTMNVFFKRIAFVKVIVTGILFEEKICQALSCKVIQVHNKHMYILVLSVKETN